MKKAQDDVTAFHRAMKQPIGDMAAPAFGRVGLRLGLIDEERRELQEAADKSDIVASADALADLCYVVIGTAVEWGIDLAAVWDEVHRSNMAKVGGPVREDGKVLKPPGWVPPDVAGVLAVQVEKNRVDPFCGECRTRICPLFGCACP